MRRARVITRSGNSLARGDAFLRPGGIRLSASPVPVAPGIPDAGGRGLWWVVLIVLPGPARADPARGPRWACGGNVAPLEVRIRRWL